MTTQSIALNDGHSMPRLGYGLWQISARDAEPLVGSAIESGFRHFDTERRRDGSDSQPRSTRWQHSTIAGRHELLVLKPFARRAPRLETCVQLILGVNNLCLREPGMRVGKRR